MEQQPEKPAEIRPPQDILHRSILCKPFLNAVEAAQVVRDVVADSIENKYEDMESRFPVGGWRMVAYIWSALAPFASFALLMFSLSLGSPALAALGFLTLVPVLVAAGMEENEKKLCRQLTRADKDLSSATLIVPDLRAKTSLREFSKAASRAFAFGEIAVMQELVAAGQAPVSKLQEYQEEGLGIIEKMAAIRRWDETKREKVAAAFKAGRMPPPHTIRAGIDRRMERLRQELSQMTSAT